MIVILLIVNLESEGPVPKLTPAPYLHTLYEVSINIINSTNTTSTSFPWRSAT